MYNTGDLVKISGYGDCAIKSGYVQRIIVDCHQLSGQTFYKCDTGMLSHWYSESRVLLVNPPVVKPVAHGNITRLRVRKYTSSKQVSINIRPRKMDKCAVCQNMIGV